MPKTGKTLRTFDTVMPHLRRNWLRILVGILLIVAVDIAQLIIPKIMQVTIDKIGANAITQSGLLKVGLLVLGLSLAIAAIRFLWRLILIGTAWSLDRDLRQDYYQQLLKLSQNFFNRVKTGDLMALATNDINAVRMLFGFGFVVAVDIVFLSISTLGFMMSYNVRLTLMAIIPLPLLSMITIVFGRRIHKLFGRVQKIFADVSGIVQESISGIRVIKAFHQEEAELQKMSKTAYDYVTQNIRLVKISQGLFHPFMFLIISFSMLIVMVVGGESALLGEVSMGEFIAFFQYLGMLVWPMMAIGWIVNLYQRGTASLNRLNEIFAEEPEIADDADIKPVPSLKGTLEIRNLCFRYHDEAPWIFRDISFSLDAGNTLAIVGRTGCGKTTLIDLLARVYNPPRNSFYIDGHELFSIPLDDLHQNIVTVPQEIFLFSDTIEGNIALGRPEASRREVEEAAKTAQVYNDIIEFEEGFDTVIGERGVTLSGGQKQRLAIARALLTDPNILVIDDSLSAVDTKTEKEILSALIENRRNKTTIIIAHRISAIQHANTILVLDDGHIVEQGNHQSLLALGGIYHNLHEKQQIEERLK